MPTPSVVIDHETDPRDNEGSNGKDLMEKLTTQENAPVITQSAAITMAESVAEVPHQPVLNTIRLQTPGFNHKRNHSVNFGNIKQIEPTLPILKEDQDQDITLDEVYPSNQDTNFGAGRTQDREEYISDTTGMHNQNNQERVFRVHDVVSKFESEHQKHLSGRVVGQNSKPILYNRPASRRLSSNKFQLQNVLAKGVSENLLRRRLTKKEDKKIVAAQEDLAMWSETDVHFALHEEDDEHNENNNGIHERLSTFVYSRNTFYNRNVGYDDRGAADQLGLSAVSVIEASSPMHAHSSSIQSSSALAAAMSTDLGLPRDDPLQTELNSQTLSGAELEENTTSDPDTKSKAPVRRVSYIDKQHVYKLQQAIKELQFLRFCYYMLCWHVYWLFYTLLIIAEPVLASYNPYAYPGTYLAQQIILIINALLVGISLAGHLYYHKTVIQMKQNNLKISYWTAFKTMHWNTPIVLEVTCIVTGLIFIWSYPGIALLRLFRVFRTLFYHDGKDGLPKSVLDPLTGMLSCVIGEFYVLLLMRVLKFASYSLQNMGREIFALTNKSKGGFILLFMMLFSAYVLGTVFWIVLLPEGTDNELCNSLHSCVFTMIRLSFFDGNGFDFAYSMLFSHPRLFVILIVYFFLTAIGMANGLIGVFGEIFRNNSQIAFKTDQIRKKEEEDLIEKHDAIEFRIQTADRISHLETKLEAIEVLLKALVAAQQNIQPN